MTTPHSHNSLTEGYCDFCQQALSAVAADNSLVCERINCKLRQLQQKTSSQTENYRQQQEQILIDNSCNALELTPEQLQLVSIPFNAHQITTLDYEVIEAFEQHLQQLVQCHSGENASDYINDFLDPDDVEQLNDALVAACRACRGHCCLNGREYFAFIDEATISRVMSQQEVELESIPELYLSHIPSHSMKDGCVYQTDNGCCLPDELRADTCEQYFCSGLLDFIESADNCSSKQTVLAVWKNDDLIEHLYVESSS